MSSLNFNTAKSYVEKYDGLINENLANISNYLTALKADISSEVTAALTMANPEPAITDTTQLDAAWWAEHGEEYGWIKKGNFYYKFDEASGKTYAFNPNAGDANFKDAGKLIVYEGEYYGTGKAPCKNEIECALYVNGNLSDVTEVMTVVNGVNTVSHYSDCPNQGKENTLYIVPTNVPERNPHLSDRENNARSADYKVDVFNSSHFADLLVTSAGGTSKPHRSISGYSIGGQVAMNMCASDEFKGYYNKVALIDVAPDPAFKYSDEQKYNLSGMEFDIVLNYNNIYGNGKGSDGTLNYINSTCGGPHLDKMAEIPGVKINLVLPPIEYDTVGTIIKLTAHAEGLNNPCINISTYDLPKDMVQHYDGTYYNGNYYPSEKRKSSHKQVHSNLFPAYLSGFSQF